MFFPCLSLSIRSITDTEHFEGNPTLLTRVVGEMKMVVRGNWKGRKEEDDDKQQTGQKPTPISCCADVVVEYGYEGWRSRRDFRDSAVS